MKLTGILLSAPLIATGAKAQQNHLGPGENGINVTNETASSGHADGYDLVTLDRHVTWDDLEDDQETCAYADSTKTVGERVIRKSDCQKVVDYMAGRSGYWTVSGYGSGDVYATLTYKGTCSFAVARVDGQDLDFEVGNIDVKNFVEHAMRLTSDPSRMPTVIGTVNCEGANRPLVEWKVGLRPTGASSKVRTSVLGWVAVASVAIALAMA